MVRPGRMRRAGRLTTAHWQRVRPVAAVGTRVLPPARLEAFSDGVFAIAITLLVIELHVPTSKEALVAGLVHEWPRYLGYLVSFAFIGGVWISHSKLTRFIRVVDAPLMRLNLLLLLSVSILPFTTGVVANHLFESYLTVSHDISTSFGAERIAVDDVAEEELQRFTVERRLAFVAQACATVVGAFLPVLAVLFYLSVSVLFIVAPLTATRWRTAQTGDS